MKDIRFIAVCGPTASGKSDLAMHLARKFSGEIVCCDSVQVYRGFDIGSAKPTVQDQQEIPHHLFSIVRCDEDFSAGIYREQALGTLEKLNSRGVLPIVVGGTGLYLRALIGTRWDEQLPSDDALRTILNHKTTEELVSELQSLDPLRMQELHINDRYRLVRALELVKLTGKTALERASSSVACSAPMDPLFVLMDPPRAILHERINRRSQQMLDRGIIYEVRELRNQGCAISSKPMQSIGYAQVNQFLDGRVEANQLSELIAAATRQYAKRQVTWFRKMTADVRIQDHTNTGDIERMVEAYLRK